MGQLALLGAGPESSGPVVFDSFNRGNNASSLGNAETGQAWSPVAGTWGIASNRAYSVSDGDGDKVTIPGLGNGTVQVIFNGQWGGVTFSIPQLIARYIDSNNFLQIDFFNGSVRLAKWDGGSFATLATAAQTTTTGVDYLVKVVLNGTLVEVWVDGVQKISHTLAGGNATKYTSAVSTVGLKLGKGGSPGTPARWDNFQVAAQAWS